MKKKYDDTKQYDDFHTYTKCSTEATRRKKLDCKIYIWNVQKKQTM